MMYFFLRLRAEGRARDAIATGILWGLAVLVKEKLIFLPFVLVAFLVGARAVRRRSRLVLIFLLFVSMAAAIAPWVARGYVATGTFVPITLRSGRALNQGMNEDFSGADESLVRRFESPQERQRRELPTSEEERDERAKRGAREENALIGRAMARIASDPVAFIKAFLVKLGAFWYYGQPKVVIGNLLVQGPILLFALGGYFRGWRRLDLAPFLALSIYFVVIHALTIVRMRYSLPIMPETILVAAFFALSLAGRLSPSLPGPIEPQSPPASADSR
jgi:4-amino-4-deoxy-L-arabinose transferase-like glycosyltransferase